MDIDLLSKMVKEIILDNDEVTLPGVGTFVAEIVPSSFSDKGYTINPPYRRLSFRQREASDTRLVDFYAESNHLDRDAATAILVRFLLELKDALKERKTIIFPGLGRLRATRENHFFFVPDEDLSIYSEGFGLEPVSLKTHVETEDDLSVAMSSLQSILDVSNEDEPSVESEPDAGVEADPVAGVAIEPAIEPGLAAEEKSDPVAEAEPEPVAEARIEPAAMAEPEPVAEARIEPAAMAEPEPVAEARIEPAAMAEPEPVLKAGTAASAVGGQRRSIPMAVKLLLMMIVAAVVLVGLFILVAHLAPDFIDSILYNEEELEIIHKKWLN